MIVAMITVVITIGMLIINSITVSITMTTGGAGIEKRPKLTSHTLTQSHCRREKERHHAKAEKQPAPVHDVANKSAISPNPPPNLVNG